jgi:hypothetical protein
MGVEAKGKSSQTKQVGGDPVEFWTRPIWIGFNANYSCDGRRFVINNSVPTMPGFVANFCVFFFFFFGFWISRNLIMSWSKNHSSWRGGRLEQG